MRLLLCSLTVFCLLVVISAKKQIEENIDPIERETQEHSSKKYHKDHQKSHHHGHKHKKHSVLDQPKEAEPKPKAAPVEIPEPEIKLQSDIETNKKAINEHQRKAEVEDLQLQDLAYEESLKKEQKKKKGSHGSHHAENVAKRKEKDQKLFADQEEKNPVKEKVIEDSFEPLQETPNEAERKNKNKDKKPKDKNKKKAHEKNKDKSKKSKDGKNKNKDKKGKNKDKKKW